MTGVGVLGVVAIIGAAACSPDPAQQNPAPAAAAKVPLISTNDLPAARAGEVHLLAFNDFHGNLQPPEGSGGKIAGYAAGGASYFATHVKRLTQAYPNSAVVMAGDAIGASPLVSALFHDEPSIKFYNQIGVAASSTGNHEFDHGMIELKRIAEGGCSPIDGCQPGDPFTGAKFPYLAANVTDAAGNQPPGLEAWTTLDIGGHKIGFIGVVTKSAVNLVEPSGIRGYTFGDEPDAVNKYVPAVKAAGAETVVVLVHEGGQQTLPAGSDADYNKCDSITPKATDLASRMDPAVGVIVSGHTHQPYVCTIAGKLITQASFYGKLITDITLTFDGTTLKSAAGVNRVITRDVPEDADVKKLVDFYATEAKPRANRVIGSITGDVTKAAFPAGDSALGDLIADAMLASVAAPDKGGAQFSVMNAGGVRADLVAKAKPDGAVQKQDGQVTYGEAYTVQPFGNQVVTATLTGAQVLALLEQQWDNVYKPSTFAVGGITYAFSDAAPVGKKIVADSVKIAGQPLNPVGTYRVATNNFVQQGGDGFSVFTQATDVVPGPTDLDALESYFEAKGTVSAPTPGRITKQ